MKHPVDDFGRSRHDRHLQRLGPSPALTEALPVSARNVTGLLEGLEATGFVARTVHPSDRRATLVTLSEQGTAVAQAMQTDEQRLARFLFADVADDDMARLSATLDHVIARLRDPTFARLRRRALKRWPLRADD